VEFSYRLTGVGWGEAIVGCNEKTVTLTTSYLTDVLHDLLTAVQLLLEGATESRCSWDLEPGQYRWIFVRNAGSANLQILGMDDFWNDIPDDEGTEIFTCTEPLLAMATGIVLGIQSVLDQYGEDEYLERWVEHPFPTAILRAVKRLLDR
jgi:hypothetical protein